MKKINKFMRCIPSFLPAIFLGISTARVYQGKTGWLWVLIITGLYSVWFFYDLFFNKEN